MPWLNVLRLEGEGGGRLKWKKPCMLEFPSQPIESMLLWQTERLGIKGDEIQASVPSPCLVVGICSESNCKWKTHLWPCSLGGPPANPQMCAAESFWPRKGGTKAVFPRPGCLPKTRAAVKVAVPGLSPASPLNLGSDLETCRLSAAVLVLALLPLLHGQS